MPENEKEPQELGDLNTEPIEAADEDETQEVEPPKADETPEEEPPSEDEESQKADKGAEKRINQLVAKLKSTKEELSESRERIEDLQKEIDAAQDRLTQKYAYTYNGESVLEMDERKFRRVLVDLSKRTDISDAEINNRIAILEDARDNFFKEAAPIARERQLLDADTSKLWNTEWATVREEVLAINPKLEKHIAKLEQVMVQEFQERPLLVERLKRGPVEKLRYTLEVMKREGISHELELEAYADDRPAPGQNSAGRGKASPPVKTKSPSFSRDQIAKMSLADYVKNEKAIDEAAKAGRIR